jgi:hypothetical protein
MGEGEILALVQQRRCPQRVGEPGRAGLGEAGQGGRVAQRRVPSEDGNSVGQRARPVGQPGKLTADGTGDLFGPKGTEPPRSVVARLASVGSKLAEQQAQQERVAGCDRMAGAGEGRAGLRHPVTHQHRSRVRAKGPRPHRWVWRRREQLRKQPGVAGRLTRPHRAQHAEREPV